MFKSGLVSVSFRKLMPEEVIDLVCKAGLDGIEWGGDIHVPHGDLKRAKQVYALATDRGIATAAYGSYYRAGIETIATEGSDKLEFEKVLETAVELHADTIRIWAGSVGSADADPRYRSRVTEDIFACADMALKSGTAVALEYHGNTLTDTLNSTVELMQQVNHKNLSVYWQPPVNSTLQNNLAAIEILLPYMSNIHMFYWEGAGRKPLSEGEGLWDQYLARINNSGRQRYALLEFVKEDSAEQFLCDAEVLKRILGKFSVS